MSSAPVHGRRLAVSLAGLALLASACGSDPGPTADTAEAAAAAAAADANIDGLQSSDDVFDVEVLDVADGSVSSLRAAVDGDRPVLLWFWAPH